MDRATLCDGNAPGKGRFLVCCTFSIDRQSRPPRTSLAFESCRNQEPIPSRFSERRQLDIYDQSEQRVLGDILADLESALPEPLAHDYDQQLQRARESIRDTTA